MHSFLYYYSVPICYLYKALVITIWIIPLWIEEVVLTLEQWSFLFQIIVSLYWGLSLGPSDPEVNDIPMCHRASPNYVFCLSLASSCFRASFFSNFMFLENYIYYSWSLLFQKVSRVLSWVSINFKYLSWWSFSKNNFNI